MAPWVHHREAIMFHSRNPNGEDHAGPYFATGIAIAIILTVIFSSKGRPQGRQQAVFRAVGVSTAAAHR
jgi:hypothetical protein